MSTSDCLTRIASRLHALDVGGYFTDLPAAIRFAIREDIIELHEITDRVIEDEEANRPRTPRELQPIREVVERVVSPAGRRQVIPVLVVGR